MEFFKNALFKAARLGDKIILVSHVPKRQTGITCLDCGDDLTVKKGEKNIHHFSHKKGSKCGSVSGNVGSGESKTHNDAKYRIVERFQSSSDMKITRRTCYRCYKTETIHDLTRYKNNGYFACIEYGYLDLKKVARKADVAIIDNSGNIHMVIEILHRHATPEANREGYNWIELNADSVVNNKDDHYICVRESPNICYKCDAEIKERQIRLAKMQLERERELEKKRIMEELRKQQDEIDRLEQEKQAKIIRERRKQQEEQERKEFEELENIVSKNMVSLAEKYAKRKELERYEKRERKRLDELEAQRIKNDEIERLKKLESARLYNISDIVRCEKLARKELQKCARCKTGTCITCRCRIATRVKELREGC